MGFFACETHAKSEAKTGVIQGEEARPKAPPIAKGVITGGSLSSINRKSGPFGNWNFKIPNKFRPIIIAIKATKDVKKEGNCPYIFPNNPLNAPNVISEKITPPEKLISLNLFFLVPPTYAIVIGSKDKEHGPRLVKRPAAKTKNIVNGPG